MSLWKIGCGIFLYTLIGLTFEVRHELKRRIRYIRAGRETLQWVDAPIWTLLWLPIFFSRLVAWSLWQPFSAVEAYLDRKTTVVRIERELNHTKKNT